MTITPGGPQGGRGKRRRRHRIIEHPADLGIEAEGPSMAEAFAAAAEALMSVIVDTTRAGEDLPRMVALEAGDYEQLLVRWLSEVLWQYDGGNFVSKRFVISDISPTALRATLLGEMFDTGKHPPRLDVKAVTYHQVRAEEAGGRAVVRVYLDI